MILVLTRELALRYAFLEQGVSDFLRGGSDEYLSVAKAEEAGERLAVTWIFGDEQDYPFSFDSTCDFLDIDSEVLRKALVRKVLYDHAGISLSC